MGIKSFFVLPLATWQAKRIRKQAKMAIENQNFWFNKLIDRAEKTVFGTEHGLRVGMTYAEFQAAVPLTDYEGLAPYIERTIKGQANVLWPGSPMYFAKTSGTTSGTKFIPITKESLPFHVGSARNAVFCYVADTKDASVFDGKMIFLSGSPILDKIGTIKTGRLSGIVNHHIPGFVKKNQLPSWETNCIEDWELKLQHIIKETKGKDLRLIGGIPSWVQMYFEQLLQGSPAATITDLFPNLGLYVFGGVNFEPYRARFERLLGKGVKTIETYPASEGFIAFQDSQTEEGLLLQTNVGIFYEFVPAKEMGSDSPTRLSLDQVQLDENYAIILNTNAGLWGYVIGDTVRFVSLNPYRIKVTGRIKHFISAFGEHVIGEEVDLAMKAAIHQFNLNVLEFHVAPLVQPKDNGLPRHQWFIEFSSVPENIPEIERFLDTQMQAQNSYYRDLIEGSILRHLEICPVVSNGFTDYMKSVGKLGGQNKVPRLADDRKIADALTILPA
ncbi:MAG: GH3 family domain-containing protein [Flavobacteriales bacterium]